MKLDEFMDYLNNRGEFGTYMENQINSIAKTLDKIENSSLDKYVPKGGGSIQEIATALEQENRYLRNEVTRFNLAIIDAREQLRKVKTDFKDTKMLFNQELTGVKRIASMLKIVAVAVRDLDKEEIIKSKGDK